MGYLTKSFETLIICCQGDFTKPSFLLFSALMTGWVLSVRHLELLRLIAITLMLKTLFSRHSWNQILRERAAEVRMPWRRNNHENEQPS